MSNHYHTILPVDAPATAAILNEKIAALDRQLWMISRGEVDWYDFAAGDLVANPAAGYVKTFFRGTKFIMRDSAGVEGGPGRFDRYALLQDQKPNGTNGGTFPISYVVRDLNTIVTDTAGIVSLAANIFTLQAGSYIIHAQAPARGVNGHSCGIWRISDGLFTPGSSNFADAANNQSNLSHVWLYTTIAGAESYRLEHRKTVVADIVDGLGVATSAGIEVYGQVEIWKV